MLTDPASLGNPPLPDAEKCFEPEYWRARGELHDVSGGRGSAWFIGSAANHWVLRHFRRGGFIARFSQDSFVWSGEERVRAFAEFRLLAALVERGLPVPQPIAARYQRSGFRYRCDLITKRIAGAKPLSAALVSAALPEPVWRNVGAAVGRLHRAGVDHADLNAHNILLDANGTVSLIDFDRGRLREPGGWAAENMQRLHRSLVKVSRDLPRGRFSRAAWQWLSDAYRD